MGVKLLNKNWSRVHRTGSLLCPPSPHIGNGLLPLSLCLRSCYCGEVFCCSHRTCIVQIVCYITLGCFFPIRSPISLQSEDLSHGSQLWMCYRKWWGLPALWQSAERYVILKFLYMSDDKTEWFLNCLSTFCQYQLAHDYQTIHVGISHWILVFDTWEFGGAGSVYSMISVMVGV